MREILIDKITDTSIKQLESDWEHLVYDWLFGIVQHLIFIFIHVSKRSWFHLVLLTRSLWCLSVCDKHTQKLSGSCHVCSWVSAADSVNHLPNCNLQTHTTQCLTSCMFGLFHIYVWAGKTVWRLGEWKCCREEDMLKSLLYFYSTSNKNLKYRDEFRAACLWKVKPMSWFGIK